MANARVYGLLVSLVCALGAVGLPALVLPGQALAADKDDEIDYLELAGRLLADDHLDRAATALRSVNTKNPETDMHRFHLLSGLIALRQQLFAEAAPHFEEAIRIKPQNILDQDEDDEEKAAAYKPDPRLYLYLAQAEFGQQKPAETIAALDKAGDGLDDDKGAYLLRAQAEWTLERQGPALQTLSKAIKRFPKEGRFQRMKIFFLIELNLFQEATAIGERYLNRSDTDAGDYVAIGEALRRGKQFDKAAQVLEAAHLRFPDDDKIMLALAHAQLELGHQLGAAMVLESAAMQDPTYTEPAAEMYRQAQRLDRALQLNARISDQKAKFKQRLAILLDTQRFLQVAGMAPTMERLGLTRDDQIRYALAFGFYKVGDQAQAERYLRGIGDPQLFDNANGLRRAMRACPPDSWECF